MNWKQKYDYLRNFHGFATILVAIFAPWKMGVTIFIITVLLYLSLATQIGLYFISADFRFRPKVEDFFSAPSNLLLTVLFLLVLPIQIITVQLRDFIDGTYMSTTFLPLTKLLLGYTFFILLAFVKLDIRADRMELVDGIDI